MSLLSQSALTAMREADSERQGRWLNRGEADRHALLVHIDRLNERLSALESHQRWRSVADQPTVEGLYVVRWMIGDVVTGGIADYATRRTWRADADWLGPLPDLPAKGNE